MQVYTVCVHLSDNTSTSSKMIINHKVLTFTSILASEWHHLLDFMRPVSSCGLLEFLVLVV